jgi:Membrane carboxypeptidase (penicillin-binding protein)
MNWKGYFWRGLLGLVVFIVLYQLWVAVHVWWWIDHNPDSSAFMEKQLEILQDKNPDAELRHRWVPYSRISNHLKRAVIAAEDSNFVDHEGFDWEGIQKAYEKNLKKRQDRRRRLNHQPATGQKPVSLWTAHALAQTGRSHDYRHDGTDDEQATDSGDLP